MSDQVYLADLAALRALSGFLKQYIAESQQTVVKDIRCLNHQLEWVRTKEILAKQNVALTVDDINRLNREEDAQEIGRLRRKLNKQKDLLEFFRSNALNLAYENKRLQSSIKLIARNEEEIVSDGRKKLLQITNILSTYVSSESLPGSHAAITSNEHNFGEISSDHIYKHISIRGGQLESVLVTSMNFTDSDLVELDKDFENLDYLNALQVELDILSKKVDPLVKQGYSLEMLERHDLDSGAIGKPTSMSNVFTKYYRFDPIAVSRIDGGFSFSNGRHRVAWARKIGIDALPVLILKS